MSIKKIGGASPIDEGTSADALMRRRMSQSMLRWSARPSKRCSPSFFAQKLSGFYEKIQSIFPFGFAKSCFCAKKPFVCLFARPRGVVRLSGGLPPCRPSRARPPAWRRACWRPRFPWPRPSAVAVAPLRALRPLRAAPAPSCLRAWPAVGGLRWRARPARVGGVGVRRAAARRAVNHVTNHDHNHNHDHRGRRVAGRRRARRGLARCGALRRLRRLCRPLASAPCVLRRLFPSVSRARG